MDSKRKIIEQLMAGQAQGFNQSPSTVDVRDILADTVVDRGTFAPIAENADGSFSLAWPHAVREPFAAASRMLSPGYDYGDTKQAVADALAASSLGVTGGMAGRMAGQAARSAAPNPTAELPSHLRPQNAATRAAEYSAQRMRPDETASVTMQRAYDDFRSWSAANGQTPVSFDQFRLAMQDAGLMPQHIAGQTRYVGVGLPDQSPAGGVQRFGPMQMGAANDDVRGPWQVK